MDLYIKQKKWYIYQTYYCVSITKSLRFLLSRWWSMFPVVTDHTALILTYESFPCSTKFCWQQYAWLPVKLKSEWFCLIILNFVLRLYSVRLVDTMNYLLYTSAYNKIKIIFFLTAVRETTKIFISINMSRTNML